MSFLELFYERSPVVLPGVLGVGLTGIIVTLTNLLFSVSSFVKIPTLFLLATQYS